jgi:hypothetical protein
VSGAPQPIAQYLPSDTVISENSGWPRCTSGSRSTVRIHTSPDVQAFRSESSMDKTSVQLMRCLRTTFAMNVDHANGDRNFGARCRPLDAVRDIRR